MGAAVIWYAARPRNATVLRTAFYYPTESAQEAYAQTSPSCADALPFVARVSSYAKGGLEARACSVERGERLC